MSTYRFNVADMYAEPFAIAPQLTAQLHIEETTGQTVHAIALHCQVRIEPQRRRYDDAERAKLRGIFGDHERWGETLKPFQWMQCDTTVQGFVDATDVDLVLPCTYDFEVTAAQYLHGLDDGGVPLNLLFSGTVFTKGTTGFSVERIPWDCEARYQLPVAVWRDMISAHYPNTGWVRMEHDTLAMLTDYRARHGLTSWDETARSLLSREEEPVS